MSFDENFVWGAATSSYQIEGSVDADGKGTSIWDIFANSPGTIVDNHNEMLPVTITEGTKKMLKAWKKWGLKPIAFL